MTGAALFLLGTVALTNVGFLLYLVKDHNKKVKKVDEKAEPEKPANKSDGETVVKRQALVGKSKTVIEEFDIRFGQFEKKVEKMYQMLEQLEGDVRLKDVEFRNSDDAPSKEDIAKDEAEGKANGEARLSPEQESAAFVDVRIDEVDPDMVSAPSATGATTDDIEKSIEVAVNPNATEEEKAKAGEVLSQFQDTQLLDIFTTDDSIYKGVMACIRENCRIEFSDKPPHKPVAISHKKTTFILPDKVDDFDPESVFNL